MFLRLKLSIFLILLTTSLNYASNDKVFVKITQDTLQLKSSYKASQLLEAGKKEEVIIFCKTEIAKLLKEPVIDSLEVAELYKYQNKAHYQLEDYLESIKVLEKAITFCNDSEAGRLLKGQLYSDKASSYNYTEKDKATFNSTLNAIKYLRSVKNLDYDYLITSYRYLSEQCAYHGNFDEAKQYLRQAEDLYSKNREAVDLAVTRSDGYRYKYDIILLYSKVYQLYTYGQTREDSLAIVESVHRFEELHGIPDFNIVHDGVYYTTALNHVGDWYASRKPEAETTSKDIETAFYYLNKAIDLVENKGYKGNAVTYKYNKVKALALSNKLKEADKLISELLKPLADTDGRKPYFLAQKALVKAKQKQKDSAVMLFSEALEIVHSDSIKLAKNFSNFKPSKAYGHTKLLLRIAEELDRYFPKDTDVKKIVARLYAIAFLQFENSYDKRKFNKTQKTYLSQIVLGILETKKMGYNQEVDPIDVLNRFENIQNLLAWQKFNQNRQMNSFPELDSLQLRTYKLRSLIADAKYEDATSVEDSLQILLSQTGKFTKETYPNLRLFTEKEFKVEALQSQLKENQLLIKYILFDDQIVMYSILKNDVNVVLKSCTELDTKKINQFVATLKRKEFDTEEAAEIASLVLPEIDKSIEHIIINPDGILATLAFEVLSKNNSLLTEQYAISYTSSLGFVFPEVTQANYNSELAVYAPEYPNANVELAVRSEPVFLKGAQKESELISQLFSSNLYKGQQLTKQDFVETASQHKLLHLAMHAEVNTKESSMSRLLFGDENSQEDDLYLEELYGLNLSADLAVLSACNTGVDASNLGVDIESFQRAFTFAGVPATVASLWEVPDQATKEIMVSFYQNLKEGQLKSQALKNAKLAYRRTYADTKMAAPYYWAGFVLYGEDKPVNDKESHLLWYGILGLCAFSLAIALFYRSKKRKRLNT